MENRVGGYESREKWLLKAAGFFLICVTVLGSFLSSRFFNGIDVGSVLLAVIGPALVAGLAYYYYSEGRRGRESVQRVTYGEEEMSFDPIDFPQLPDGATRCHVKRTFKTEEITFEAIPRRPPQHHTEKLPALPQLDYKEGKEEKIDKIQVPRRSHSDTRSPPAIKQKPRSSSDASPRRNTRDYPLAIRETTQQKEDLKQREKRKTSSTEEAATHVLHQTTNTKTTDNKEEAIRLPIKIQPPSGDLPFSKSDDERSFIPLSVNGQNESRQRQGKYNIHESRVRVQVERKSRKSKSETGGIYDESEFELVPSEKERRKRQGPGKKWRKRGGYLVPVIVRASDDDFFPAIHHSTASNQHPEAENEACTCGLDEWEAQVTLNASDAREQRDHCYCYCRIQSLGTEKESFYQQCLHGQKDGERKHRFHRFHHSRAAQCGLAVMIVTSIFFFDKNPSLPRVMTSLPESIAEWTNSCEAFPSVIGFLIGAILYSIFYN